MPGSYPFPTYSGLLEPKHYKQISSALWLFLWCVSSTTKEVEKDGVVWGIVLGNKPVSAKELGDQFEVDEKTIRRWVKTLVEYKYIRATRAPNGFILTVRNSKKFVDKNVRSLERERTEMPDHYDRDRTLLPDLPDNNVRSNKDITEIYKAAVVVDEDDLILKAQQVEAHFVMRRGKGFAVSSLDFREIKTMIADGIPISVINECIDRSFAEFQPRHKRDEIRSITYCVPRIYDEWEKLRTDKPITGAVPHVPVALGIPKARKSRQQQELEELERMREEALKHEHV